MDFSKSFASGGLFDYPLPVPSQTIYQEINLGPEATLEEIQWAVTAVNNGRRAEQSTVKEKIKAVLARVPGLQEAYVELDRSGASSSQDESKLARLQKRVGLLERKALAIAPNFFKYREQDKLLEQQIQQLNLLALDQPDKRREYDELHPPCALLKLANAARDDFLDLPRDLLWLLRREVTKFLERKGEAVCYASDLDREDFSADFTWHPLIDEQEQR